MSRLVKTASFCPFVILLNMNHYIGNAALKVSLVPPIFSTFKIKHVTEVGLWLNQEQLGPLFKLLFHLSLSRQFPLKNYFKLFFPYRFTRLLHQATWSSIFMCCADLSKQGCWDWWRNSRWLRWFSQTLLKSLLCIDQFLGSVIKIQSDTELKLMGLAWMFSIALSRGTCLIY